LRQADLVLLIGICDEVQEIPKLVQVVIGEWVRAEMHDLITNAPIGLQVTYEHLPICQPSQTFELAVNLEKPLNLAPVQGLWAPLELLLSL
jgi:hypothetical protein